MLYVCCLSKVVVPSCWLVYSSCVWMNGKSTGVATEKKAEEEKAEMLVAIEKSGLSYSEVMELLK